MILASDWVAFHADRTPNKIALIDQHTGQELSYFALNQRASQLATVMRDDWGAVAGDRLAILAKNSSEYFVFQCACIKLGAMMLPLNWRLAVPELIFICNNAEAKGIVYDNCFSEHIPNLLDKTSLLYCLRITQDEIANDDLPSYENAVTSASPDVVMNPQTTHDTPMTIMYTSGTTGHPKGVIITHGMTFWNAINISVPTGLNCNSVQYVVLPLFHTGGLNLYANPLLHYGGTSIIARDYEPEIALKTLSAPDLAVTHFFGVPAIYLFLSQHPDFDKVDLRQIESWGCGGAPMPASLLGAYAKRGIIIQLGFGMTETSPTVFLIAKRRALVKPTSVGKPLLHTHVRIVDDDFDDVPVGEVGEVVISGANITPEYWRRDDANKTNFTLDEYGNRWLHSGDAGTMDDEGCIYIVDRYKDMYISGGENVYPAEIEQVIFQLDTIADVAVIGMPHERWGETGKAIIVPKAGQKIDPVQVIQHCEKKLAKFKVPQSVEFIDELPRNAAGKVLKRALRATYDK